MRESDSQKLFTTVTPSLIRGSAIAGSVLRGKEKKGIEK